MLDVGIVDMNAAAIVVGNGVCTAVVGTTAASDMVYRHADTSAYIAGCSIGPHMLVVVVALVPVVLEADVAVGTVALAALQLSTSPTPFLVRIPFAANATSAALGISGCVHTDCFCNRRNSSVYRHVGTSNYNVLAGSS